MARPRLRPVEATVRVDREVGVARLLIACALAYLDFDSVLTYSTTLRISSSERW
jgi:hypothetical protein